MRYALWLLWLIGGYLYGSVSYALIVTRWQRNQDIRTLGNLNAGAANVRRNVGFQWGVFVFFLDISKSVVPMLLARATLRSAGATFSFFALLTVGVAAVVGHCRPLYYGFRGGRGIATAIGIYAWFVPIELIAAMLVGVGLVVLLVHNVEHRIGPYTPIAFVTLTPVFVLITNLFLNVHFTSWLVLGDRPAYVVAAMFLLSIFILAINLPFMLERSREFRTARSKEDDDETPEANGAR